MDESIAINVKEAPSIRIKESTVESVAEDVLTGILGWLAVASLITVWDVVAKKTNRVETLSTAAWSMQRDPLKGLVAGAVWGAITWHIFCDRGVTPHIIGEK